MNESVQHADGLARELDASELAAVSGGDSPIGYGIGYLVGYAVGYLVQSFNEADF